jgi:hypothetical protein
MAFQMTFACITPALIIGAIAERIRFSALIVFVILWVTVIYFPIAHMVWYWAGPDALASASKALLDAADDAAKATAQANLDAVVSDAGMLFQWGALDFAGGTVVHINAGIAGLVGALMIGKRTGYGKELMSPHSLTMTMIGAALLWVGWFGFNAGSNLEANGVTALAFVNTFVATAAAAASWLVVEWMAKGKPSLLGLVSGAVAGLVAITPSVMTTRSMSSASTASAEFLARLPPAFLSARVSAEQASLITSPRRAPSSKVPTPSAANSGSKARPWSSRFSGRASVRQSSSSSSISSSACVSPSNRNAKASTSQAMASAPIITKRRHAGGPPPAISSQNLGAVGNNRPIFLKILSRLIRH